MRRIPSHWRTIGLERVCGEVHRGLPARRGGVFVAGVVARRPAEGKQDELRSIFACIAARKTATPTPCPEMPGFFERPWGRYEEITVL